MFKAQKKLQTRFTSLLLFLISATLILTGCGGSSGSSSPSAPSISGVVADGYLEGATVFLDMNGNRLRDDGEPYTTSGADGSYTISNITVEDYNSYPVVAEVTVTTVDQDTNKPVSHPYTLVAPAGHPEFVSPLTTMVQVSYESNPSMSLDEAAMAVKEMMNVENTAEVDLFADYVAEKDDADALANDYAKLHNVAQLTARIMGANVSVLEDAADTAGVDLDEAKDEILRIAVKEIIQSMEVIEDAASDDPEFNADQVIQALEVEIEADDIDDIVDDISVEEDAAEYQAPAIRWAGFFRSSGATTDDYACLGLEQEVDLAEYAFTFEHTDGTVYEFTEMELTDEPWSPMAWTKKFADLPAGEYTFYVTVPGGQRVKLATDTHTHTVVTGIGTDGNYVVHTAAPYSQVFHETLPDNTFYYRMAIWDTDAGAIVYRSKRRNRNIQYFPSEYATSRYRYRIEAWDNNIFKDATGRFRTAWTNINPSDALATDTFVYYYKGYRRVRYEANGEDTTGSSNRTVLQIAVTNPDNIQRLRLYYGANPNPDVDTPIHNYSLDMEPGQETDGWPDFWFARGSGITNEENGSMDYADYYFHLYGDPDSGVYTWLVELIEGDTFTHSVTVYDWVQPAMPCVQPGTVTISEDQYGDITMNWGAVDWPGKPVFYRIAIYKDGLFDNGFFSMRIPENTWTGNRAAIEAAFGSSMDEGAITYTIWAIDAQYFSMVRNRTDHKQVAFSIN